MKNFGTDIVINKDYYESKNDIYYKDPKMNKIN